MDYRHVIKQLGILIMLVATFMLTSVFWAVRENNTDVMWAFIWSIIIGLLIGGGCILQTRTKQGQLLRKEALAVVGLSWFACGLLGALPYIFSGVLNTPGQSGLDIFASAVFESVSGMTTTGASVFQHPEQLPRGILFWRSLTHWLGGMGIIVLFVAILGSTGSGGKFLVSSEVTGPLSESIRPRIRQTALLLWKIYISLSALLCVSLKVQGMSWFDALCHAFGTLATGGFSTRNDSIGFYGNYVFELTILIFMVLAGINFNLYAGLLKGQWRLVLRNKEMRVYFGLLILVTSMVSLDLLLNRADSYGFEKALRAASFQTVSIMTTTGYATDDFDQWPTFSRWIMLMIMFIGGSAGSTSGGIKVIRIMIFIRVFLQEIERTFRPNVVRPLIVNGKNVGEQLRRNVSSYIGYVLFLWLFSTMILIILHNGLRDEAVVSLDLTSAFTSVITSINNIGPGLNLVGPKQNFSFFTAPAKLFLSLLMIIGRLEVMVVFCLFMPAFWRDH